MARPACRGGTGARLTVHVENVGDDVASFSAASSGDFIVDGVAQPRGSFVFDGMDSLHPNAVWTFEHELALARGTHRVRTWSAARRRTRSPST